MNKMLVAFGVAMVLSSRIWAATEISGEYESYRLTVGESYELSGDATIGALDATACTDAAQASIDLNGHSLSVTGVTLGGSYTYTDSKIVVAFTNGQPGDPAELKLGKADDANAFKYQLRHLQFTGNLHLTLTGGNSNDNAGFQGVNNTHTGGTTLDGYGKTASSNLPRWNTDSAFGTGVLTLKNGAKIKCTGSNTQKISGLVVEDDGANVNRIELDNSGVIFDCPVSVAAESTLQIQYGNGWRRFRDCDLTGVRGRIVFEGNGTGELDIYTSAPNARFELSPHTAADRYTDVRFNADDAIPLPDPLEIGMLASTDGVTAYDDHMYFTPNLGGKLAALRVGGTDADGAFYGNLRKFGANDWSVEKVGRGTWTLGGENSYEGVTTVSGGILRFVDQGRPGTGKSALVFNGGTVSFAANAKREISNALQAAGDQTVRLDAEAGATAVLSGSVTGIEGGLEKTGEGAVTVKNLVLAQTAETGGLAVRDGGKATLAAGTLGADELQLDAHETLDLNGANLTVRKVSQTSEANASATVKNTSEVLSTFTVGVGNGKLANKLFILEGNLRYVVTGNDGTHFRQVNDQGGDIPNTHTGGTVFDNTTSQIRFYTQANFGTGPIVLKNASVFYPSTNGALGDHNFTNPWEFYGENNKLQIEGYSGGPTVNLKGAWSGDGTVNVFNGWKPTIELNGDMAAFAGTLALAYKDGENRAFWMRGDNTNGLPRATLRLGNVADVTDPAKRLTQIRVKPGNNASVTHAETIRTFPIGHLETTSADAEEHQNTWLMNCQQWADSTWEIGALGKDGVFAGSFTQETANAHLAITKVGAGTWTWTSSKQAFDGPLTVAEGQLVLASETFRSAQVVVKAGATLAGTATLSEKALVTVENGGILAGSLAFDAGLTLNEGAVLGRGAQIKAAVDLAKVNVQCPAAAELPTDREEKKAYSQVLCTVSSASGEAALPADIAALNAADMRGRWKIRKIANAATGMVDLVLSYSGNGLIILFH